MVLPLSSSPKEVDLLAPIRKPSDTTIRSVQSFDHAVVEAILRAKDEEIKALQQRIAELEANASEKEKGNEKEKAAEEAVENVAEKEAGKSIGEEKGGEKTCGLGEGAEKMKNADRLDAGESKGTVGEKGESGKGKDGDSDDKDDDDGVSEASMNDPIINEELVNAPVIIEESMNDPTIDEESVNATLALASSIMVNVQSRTDRVPKRKLDFVTPPSTIPSSRVKQLVVRGCVHGCGRARNTESTGEAVLVARMMRIRKIRGKA